MKSTPPSFACLWCPPRFTFPAEMSGNSLLFEIVPLNVMTGVQEGLRLGPAQVQELVAARRRLLACLLTVQTRREDAILAMGLALLQQAPSSVRAQPLLTCCYEQNHPSLVAGCSQQDAS